MKWQEAGKEEEKKLNKKGARWKIRKEMKNKKKSIQFDNKDVHLNKRINEAKNSMKCDAIYRTYCELEIFPVPLLAQQTPILA